MGGAIGYAGHRTPRSSLALIRSARLLVGRHIWAGKLPNLRCRAPVAAIPPVVLGLRAAEANVDNHNAARCVDTQRVAAARGLRCLVCTRHGCEEPELRTESSRVPAPAHAMTATA